MFEMLLAAVFFAVLVGILLAIRVAKTLLVHQRSELERVAQTTLADMFLFYDPKKLFKYNLVALVVVPALIGLLTDNPVFVLISAIGIIFLPKFYVNRLRRKRLQVFEGQLPDALLMVSGAMRAGASLNVAMESMVKEQKPPISQEFELMMREQRLGVDFDTALLAMEKRVSLQDFSLVVSGMRISREVGGNLAEILESLAHSLREKSRMEGKIKSLTAQGKMQGIVMTGLPLLLMMVLNWMEPKAMGAMFTTVIGWGTLSVVIVMLGIGYIFIRKITTIDV